MKRTKRFAVLGIVLLFAVPMIVSAVPMTGTGTDALPSGYYGVSGAGVPDHVRDLLPEGFFSRSITDGLASGKNHVASLDLSASSALMDRGLARLPLDIRFHVENLSERVSDVVVSAGYDQGRRVENFILHLEPGQQISVDMGELTPAPSLHLVSLLPFTVDVSVGSSEPDDRIALDVLPPATPARASVAGSEAPAKAFGSVPAGKSQCETEQTIKICNAGTTNCVTALARRDYLTIPSGQAFGFAEIQYPIGTAFHCSDGASRFNTSSCSGTSYPTRRCDGTPFKHRWDGLDGTINSCAPSTAHCTSGCTGWWDVTC